jgi:hypothetical protein
VIWLLILAALGVLGLAVFALAQVVEERAERRADAEPRYRLILHTPRRIHR